MRLGSPWGQEIPEAMSFVLRGRQQLWGEREIFHSGQLAVKGCSAQHVQEQCLGARLEECSYLGTGLYPQGRSSTPQSVGEKDVGLGALPAGPGPHRPSHPQGSSSLSSWVGNLPLRQRALGSAALPLSQRVIQMRVWRWEGKNECQHPGAVLRKEEEERGCFCAFDADPEGRIGWEPGREQTGVLLLCYFSSSKEDKSNGLQQVPGITE